MANANAIVEKMATVGLRHGEKAGVAIAMTVFLVCVASAVSKPTIDTSPEQVKKAAQASDSNLNRTEGRDVIIKKLEETDKIAPTDFAGTVEQQIKVQLVADVYKPQRTWVSPEPGAGLIRETPELIAPSELYAYPGRGGLLVYARDAEGNKIPIKEGEDEPEKKQKLGNLHKSKRKGRGGGGMMGGMGGQAKKKKRRKSKVEIEREEKEDQIRKAKALKNSFAGGNAGADLAETKVETETEEGGPFKEVTKGYRWVAITGTLDHSKIVANYRAALKNPAIAHPQYVRMDLQRRTLQPDGTWSAWQDVAEEKNLDILDNVPYSEEELAPAKVLPEGLVDPLPFLNAGLYEKVHIASLVPKEKTELPEEPKNQRGMPGMMGMMGSARGGTAGMQTQMMQMQRQNMMDMMGTGSMGSMMPGASMAGGSESLGNFWRSEEKKVMIRALDFTVEPDNSYRYRVRIVVANPNYAREDVSPQTVADTKKMYLSGPWSKETDIVNMPPDIQPYAVGTMPASGQSDTKVRFQVVRFNRADGWTVPRTFETGVGGVIGEPRRTDVPRSDGSGKKNETIDFSSRQLVLDTSGGGYQNLPSGMAGPSIERPVLVALLRSDGAMVVHNQADDLANEVRKDIEANYDHEIEQSSKKRENSRGRGSAGMMGRMMGRGGGR